MITVNRHGMYNWRDKVSGEKFLKGRIVVTQNETGAVVLDITDSNGELLCEAIMNDSDYAKAKSGQFAEGRVRIPSSVEPQASEQITFAVKWEAKEQYNPLEGSILTLPKLAESIEIITGLGLSYRLSNSGATPLQSTLVVMDAA
jgi:hypothetical protein